MESNETFNWSNLILLTYYIVLIVYNIYMETVSNTIQEKNRIITGRLVWLSVLPIFGVIWMYIFNNAINKSIDKEIQEHQLDYKFLGVTGTLFPNLLLGLMTLYSVLELIYVPTEHTDSGLWAELFLFFAYLSFAFWLIYIAEVVSFIKHIKNELATDYIARTVWILTTFALLFIAYFVFNYFSELNALNDYERGLN